MPYTRLFREHACQTGARFFRICCVLLLSGWCALSANAQQVMQIETYGKAKTKKLYPGATIQYRLKHQKSDWLTGEIDAYRVEDKLVVLSDRYVHVDSIAALRFDKKWSKVVGTQLFWFGTAWSAFAFVGTLTDGDPETHYEWSDAAATGGFWLSSLLLPKLFRYRKYNMEGRHRLRLVDLQPFMGK